MLAGIEYGMQIRLSFPEWSRELFKSTYDVAEKVNE